MQRSYELDESCAMFGNTNFDALKKTVLYIHGYLEGPEHESVRVIVDAYLQRNDHNILVLDWSQLANGKYLIDVVPNAKQVLYYRFMCSDTKKCNFIWVCVFNANDLMLQLATKLSEVILDWVDEGLDVNKFHIIGQAIGGQIAGMIGRCAFRKSEGETKLSRITVFDAPAVFPLGARVNQKDADFVDIILTDTWFYSAPKSSGTVNFWPNCQRIKSSSDGKNLLRKNLFTTFNLIVIFLCQSWAFIGELGNCGQKRCNQVNNNRLSFRFMQRV